MANNNVFQGEMDPEIAALLGTSAPSKPKESPPEYARLFSEFDKSKPKDEAEAEEHSVISASFPEITKRLEDVPHKAFDDPNYYKTALSGEGDIAQRVHGLLQKYLKCNDPKDKGVFRQQLIPAFWEFLLNTAKKTPGGRVPDPKKYLLRFGILHPTFLDPENRNLFSRIIVDNNLNLPVYYLDEWFKHVGTGIVRNSSTDEVRVAKTNQSNKLQQLLEKAQGKLDGTISLLKSNDEEKKRMESALAGRVSHIAEHFPLEDLPEVSGCYSETQKRSFAEIQEISKSLLKNDRDLEIYLRDYYQAEADVKTLRQKVDEDGGAMEVDIKAVDTEFETIKQMAKMTIGRQGNHFPILTSEYFHSIQNDIGFRENIISALAWIESIDPEAFCRSHKNRLNRIIPYVVLIPTYGDTGICWEPFDRFNRATSRGRIAIPMYPKNLQMALLSAVGDLRWQVAKEKASYYWMEEGITGNYYQWFQKMKLKGDVKEAFIQDYILWMTKESDGIQKLDKEVRGVFWRHVPFSQQIKEKLKSRSYIYQELYQRDVNRSMSDGY